MPKKTGIAIITLGAVLLLSALLLFLYNGYEERRAEQNAELLLNDIKTVISNSTTTLPSVQATSETTTPSVQTPSVQTSAQEIATDDGQASNDWPTLEQTPPNEEPVTQTANENITIQQPTAAPNENQPYEEPYDDAYTVQYPYDTPMTPQPTREQRPSRPVQQATSPSFSEKYEKPQTEQPTTAASRIDGDMTVVMIHGYEYIGYLSIPDLYLELPVMSEWDYRKLEYAPCRHFGSTTKDNLVIAAHNYRSQFAHLPYLQAGAKVFFTDMNGTVIEYSLQRIEQLQADAVETVLNSGHDLVLYTCTTSGTYRIAAFFDRTV